MRQEYVVGFAFDDSRQMVVLIQKNRPEWQAGRWNGVGGKVESGESVIQAMIREFREETGVVTDESEWSLFGRLISPRSSVTLFKMFDDSVVSSVKTMTDEPIIHVPVILDLLAINGVPNLPWLVSVARSDENPLIEATYPEQGVVSEAA